MPKCLDGFGSFDHMMLLMTDVCVCLCLEFIQSITKLARLLRRRRLMDSNQIVELRFTRELTENFSTPTDERWPMAIMKLRCLASQIFA